MTTFIGDIHSDWGMYRDILYRHPGEYTYQVGDLGLGFMPLVDHSWINPYKNKFIRGNHDNPKLCSPMLGYLGDFGSFTAEGHSIFYVSGAMSMDKASRIPGKSWWPDEELSYKWLMEAIKVYSSRSSDIVLTHCAPMIIKRKLGVGYSQSITESALDTMLALRRPRLWVFGHYHQAFDETINGTRFVCVPTYGEFTI